MNIKKEGYAFLKKIKEMAGIVENYDNYDIVDYDYNITIKNESSYLFTWFVFYNVYLY